MNATFAEFTLTGKQFERVVLQSGANGYSIKNLENGKILFTCFELDADKVRKVIETKQRARKFKDFTQLDYYDFKRYCRNGIKGWLYWLCKPLTTEQIENLKQYTNISFLQSRSQFAPELVTKVIFIGD